jgi:hypothetical protein
MQLYTRQSHSLVADKVHAVPERRHKRHVGDGVERAQLVEGEGAVQVVDGDRGQGAKPAVDAAHNLVHQARQLLVLGDVSAGGDRNLD